MHPYSIMSNLAQANDYNDQNKSYKSLGFLATKSTPRVFFEVQNLVYPTILTSTNPLSSRRVTYSSGVKHPVIQLLQSSPKEHVTKANKFASTEQRSDNKNRPPGRSTRNAFANAVFLSGQRLKTPFEITTCATFGSSSGTFGSSMTALTISIFDASCPSFSSPSSSAARSLYILIL
mmetsp:Transcript_26547/g.32135  ORF Transcript_26547/g.32135 Transcript_26547/m.32135 type:complete len:177 (-) Transcript_26547:420-950(-)